MDPAGTSFWKKAVFGVISLIVLIFLYQWVSSPMVVTVTGVGEVSASAQSAVISFSLSDQNADSQAAIASLKSKIEKMKGILISYGIAQSDIYESQVTVYPGSAISPGGTGYQAIASLGAKTTRITTLDGLTSSLYANGATLVSQPVLSVDDTDSLEVKAFDLAMKDAKSQIKSIGNKNWKFIRKIILVQQSDSGSTSTVTSKADAATKAIEGGADSSVIKISKVVSVSYKMW